MTHYHRWRRHGDPGYQRPTVEERFWAKVDVRGPDECWPWTAGLFYTGYGQFQLDGRARVAHSIAYELSDGEIPEGLVMDHVCHNADEGCAGGWSCPHRRCCNPAHLEAVTPAVNNARGRGGGYKPRSHCPQGHPYSGDNLRLKPNGDRYCRECNRLRAAASYRRRCARLAPEAA